MKRQAAWLWGEKIELQTVERSSRGRSLIASYIHSSVERGVSEIK